MTYTSKFRPAGGRVVATYTCPDHGEFDAEVERDANGEAPDYIECPCEVSEEQARSTASGMLGSAICHATSANAPLPTYAELLAAARTCLAEARWTPTPIPGRVRRIEVSRGGWQKPERST
jgi:hypothetical protein